MKRTLFLVLSLFISQVFAQDLLDKIAMKSCECVQLDDIDAMSGSELENKFGICVIQEALEYPEEMLSEHGLDLSNLDAEVGEQLGTLVATRMLTHCPDVLIKLGSKSEETEDAANASLTASGTILKLEEKQFVTLILKDDAGLVTKYIWLGNFPGSYELSEGQSVQNKKVTVSFVKQEFYDPRIKDYRTFNVMTALEFL